jgi:hypothetical protein
MCTPSVRLLHFSMGQAAWYMRDLSVGRSLSLDGRTHLRRRNERVDLEKVMVAALRAPCPHPPATGIYGEGR